MFSTYPLRTSVKHEKLLIIQYVCNKLFGTIPMSDEPRFSVGIAIELFYYLSVNWATMRGNKGGMLMATSGTGLGVTRNVYKPPNNVTRSTCRRRRPNFRQTSGAFGRPSVLVCWVKNTVFANVFRARQTVVAVEGPRFYLYFFRFAPVSFREKAE